MFNVRPDTNVLISSNLPYSLQLSCLPKSILDKTLSILPRLSSSSTRFYQNVFVPNSLNSSNLQQLINSRIFIMPNQGLVSIGSSIPQVYGL